MKIVINRCYGGFGISVKALIELVKRDAACICKQTPKKYYGTSYEKRWKEDLAENYETVIDDYRVHKDEFNIYRDELLYYLVYEDNVRYDKDLVEVVETLGKESFGHHAELKVVEVPDDVDWYIDDYDGIERIHEHHQSW